MVIQGSPCLKSKAIRLLGMALFFLHCGSAQIKTIPDATQSIDTILKEDNKTEWERIELALKDENPPPERSVKLFLIKRLSETKDPRAENILWRFAQAADESLRASAWNSITKNQEKKPDFENNAIKIMARNLQSFGTLLTEELALLVNLRSASAIQLKGQSLRRMPDKSELVLNSLIEDINLEKQQIEKNSPEKPFSGLSLAENEIWNFIRENPESSIAKDALQAIRQAWGPQGNEHIYNVSRQGGFNEPALKTINTFLQKWLTPDDRKSLATTISRQLLNVDKSETIKIKALKNELAFLGYDKPLAVKSRESVNIGKAFNDKVRNGQRANTTTTISKTVNKELPKPKKNLKDLNGVEALDSFLERETGINMAGSRMHEHLLRMVNKENFDKMPESRLLFSALKNQGNGSDFFTMNKSLKKGFYNRGLLSSLLNILDKSQRSNNWKLMALRQLTGLNSTETKKVWQIWKKRRSRLLKANL